MTLDEARKVIRRGKRALSIWPSDEHGTPIGGQSNWRDSPYWVVVDARRCRPLTKAMSRAEALAEELRLRRK
jgi:hypothetical protein